MRIGSLKKLERGEALLIRATLRKLAKTQGTYDGRSGLSLSASMAMRQFAPFVRDDPWRFPN